MFRRQRKSECHRVQEMISPYLDGRVTSVGQDAVRYHIEICEDCQWEIRSLGATVQLLGRVPVASVPRSFTLAEAPPRRNWVPFALPCMTRLRMATALAIVLLAVLLAGDFSGLLHRVVIVAQVPADPVQQEQVVTDEEDPELPAEDPSEEIVEMREMKEPEAITRLREQGDEIPDDFLPVPPELPEAIHPTREPYPWLWPSQIASAALVLMLGGANLLVWQRKRGLPQLKRS